MELSQRELERAGFEVMADVVQTPEEFAQRLRTSHYDLILADYNLPQWTGIDALEQLQRQGKDIPFIMVTGFLGEEAAVDTIKKGASDYVLKDRLARLPVAVRRALEEKALQEERQRTREGLRASERKFRELLEGAPDAIVGVDSHSRIMVVNARTEKLFGYGREELIGQPVNLLVSERLREAHTRHQDRYFSDPLTRIMAPGLDLSARRKDGTEFPVEINLSPLSTQEGVLVISIIRDVTERKQLAEQLRQAQKMEAVGRLAGGIAHDFNNVLMVIKGYSELLVDRLSKDEKLRSMVVEIQDAADRAGAPTAGLQPQAGPAAASAQPQHRRHQHREDVAAPDWRRH